MPKLVKVALDIPINGLFDYSCDYIGVKIGSRVSIPFGKSLRLGVIIDIKEFKDKPTAYKLKKINKLIDEIPILSKEVLKTCEWAASYYHHPIGQVVFSALSPLHRKEKKIPKKKFEIEHKKIQHDLILNIEQNKIYENLIKHSETFSVNVIRGVTGSGKTELYAKLAQNNLEKDTQVLVMVPEINLIPQTMERFRRYLDIEPIQYHSNLTATQKYKVWEASSRESKTIVIGTRSSVFLPFKKLNLIIIDEEHDSSYKQTEMFKYNARDIGILRGRNFKCPVILGSATPSFETIYNVKIKKYNEYRLEKRYYKSKLPLISIID